MDGPGAVESLSCKDQEITVAGRGLVAESGVPWRTGAQVFSSPLFSKCADSSGKNKTAHKGNGGGSSKWLFSPPYPVKKYPTGKIGASKFPSTAYMHARFCGGGVLLLTMMSSLMWPSS